MVFCLQIDWDTCSKQATFICIWNDAVHVATKAIFTFPFLHLKQHFFSLPVFRNVCYIFTAPNVSGCSGFVIFHFIFLRSVWIWKGKDGIILALLWSTILYVFFFKNVWLRGSIKFDRVVQVFCLFVCAFLAFSAPLQPYIPFLQFSDDSFRLYTMWANFLILLTRKYSQ